MKLLQLSYKTQKPLQDIMLRMCLHSNFIKRDTGWNIVFKDRKSKFKRSIVFTAPPSGALVGEILTLFEENRPSKGHLKTIGPFKVHDILREQWQVDFISELES